MPIASETPPDQAATGALTRQLRVFKLLAAVLAAALVLGGAAFLYARHLGQPVTIFINGKPVATVRNASTANALLAAAQTAKLGPAFAGIEPVRMQKVSLERAAPEASQDPDDAVQAKLERLLTLHVPAFVILVNKQPSLAFATPDDATKTLSIVKNHWAQMPPTAGIVGQTKITQAVAIEKRTVDTKLLRSNPTQAASYYWTPPASKTYVVRPGDLGSRIAYHAHISLADLIRSNPNVNLNRLQPGEIVNIQKTPLLLTVRVQKTLQVTEKVHPNAPAYAAGQERVTYLVTYLNGQEVSREAQSVVILQKPVTAMEL